MRILHTMPVAVQASNGPTYSVVNLCKFLLAEGQEVTLAALDSKSPPPECTFLKTFPVGVGPRKLGRSPLMRRWINEQVQSNSIDLIHNHGMWQMNAIYPSSATKKVKMNLVVSPRGTFSKWAMQYGSIMKKIFWPLIQYPALQHVTCFHATCEAEYDDIRRLGFPQPVAIIPNGIDIPSLRVKTGGGNFTLLFLARINPVKGVEILLYSWKAVQDHFLDWQLVIAGGDAGDPRASKYLAQMQALSKSLGLMRISFVGEQLGVDKLSLYQKADLYVLPSYSENFAVTVAEALAAGLPAIVSKGAPWAGLKENKAGWWIDIGSDSLTRCLMEALSLSSNELQAMGLRGRQWIGNDFSWSDIGHKMIKTYQWLFEQSNPAPHWLQLK